MGSRSWRRGWLLGCVLSRAALAALNASACLALREACDAGAVTSCSALAEACSKTVHDSLWQDHIKCALVRHNYRCAETAPYAQFLNSLESPKHGELVVPAGLRVLFFGPSYMREVAQSVLCGNAVRTAEMLAWTEDTRSKSNSPQTKGRVAVALTREDDGAGVDYSGQWNDAFARFTLRNDAVLTTVFNYEPLQLQRGPGGVSSLAAFLEESAFDAAVFMAPHPKCYFDWVRNHSLPMCNDNDPARPGVEERRDYCEITRAFDTAFPDKWVFAHAWAGVWREADLKRRWPIEQRCAQHDRGAIPASSSHLRFVPPARHFETDTSAAVEAFPCRVEHNNHMACDRTLSFEEQRSAHQCLPGTPTLMAADVVAQLKQLQPTESKHDRETGETTQRT